VGLLLVVGVFYPFGRKVTPYVPPSWWHDKPRLFWWNLRDLNATECLWLGMLPLALAVAAVRRDLWLIRGVLCLVLFAFVAALLSPQPVGWATFADIRYMSTTLPLAIFLSARTVWLLFGLDRGASPGRPGLALALAAVLSFPPLGLRRRLNRAHREPATRQQRVLAAGLLPVLADVSRARAALHVAVLAAPAGRLSDAPAVQLPLPGEP